MDSTGLTPLLIDAKREYVGQLTDVLAPYIVNSFQTMAAAAAQQHPRQSVKAFQLALRNIQAWNEHSIAQHTTEIQNRYSFLGDLIAACFVSYVKILSSVKLHQQKPNIRLRLPSNEVFVHRVYIHAAREFYNAPSLLTASRDAKVGIVRSSVEASVRDMLPIEDILKAYLGNTVDATDNTLNPAEMADDEYNIPQQAQQQAQQQQAEQAADLFGPGLETPVPPAAEFQPQEAQPVQFAQQQLLQGQALPFQQPPQQQLFQQAQQPAGQPALQPAQQAPYELPQQQQAPAAAAPLPALPAAPIAQQPGAQPALFGASEEDTNPTKQISLSAQPGTAAAQALAAPSTGVVRQDLFSDAEDDF
jgi:hypothetical protein